MGLGLASSAPAWAQADNAARFAETLSIELMKLYSTTEQLDSAVTRAYGIKLSPEKIKVAREALRALMFNDRMPTYLSQFLLPLMRSGIPAKELTAAALEGILQLQVKGITRLSPERQASFASHILAMTRAASPSDCKAIFLDQLNSADSAALERKYIAALPLERFESITRLYRDAMEAELAGYPDGRVITAQQALLAEKVYEAASLKRVRAQVPLDAIRRVGADAAGAPPSEVCAVMTSTVDGMLDMSEPYKAWQLTRFVQSMH